VNRAHVRDDADLRPGDPAQLGDLAEAAHRELEDAHLRVVLEPAQREWHSDLVVEARLGGDRARDGRAECSEDVLRRRLAHRAGDPDDVRRAAVANGCSDPGQGREGVVRDERRRGAVCERILEVLGAAIDGDEEIPVDDPARVDLDTREASGSHIGSTEPCEDLGLERDHAGALSRRSTSRATSASSKGILRPAIS
jgi:hypothetical protein